MSDSRHLRRAALVVGLLILTFTALDFFVAAWPLRPSDLMWRFGTFNTLSGSLLTPLLATLVLLAVAEAGRGPRLHFTLAAALGIAAVTLAAACLPFMLDAIQLRAGVHPQSVREYDLAAARSLLKVSMGAAAAAVIAVFSFRAGRATSSRRNETGPADPALVTRSMNRTREHERVAGRRERSATG